MFTNAQIQDAVLTIIDKYQYPIWRYDDDCGLELSEYIDFATEVLKELESQS